MLANLGTLERDREYDTYGLKNVVLFIPFKLNYIISNFAQMVCIRKISQ